MADLGFPDLLSLVQTGAIIAALLLTVYFSRRTIQALSTDLETRVLNDIDEKFHRIGEVLLERPDLVRTLYRTPEVLGAEVPFAYYVSMFCAHIFHMRERGVLADNEWAGWLGWMRNAFRYGDLAVQWNEASMASWFDPSFQEFVRRELLPGSPPTPG